MGFLKLPTVTLIVFVESLPLLKVYTTVNCNEAPLNVHEVIVTVLLVSVAVQVGDELPII